MEGDIHRGETTDNNHQISETINSIQEDQATIAKSIAYVHQWFGNINKHIQDDKEVLEVAEIAKQECLKYLFSKLFKTFD